MSPHVDTSARRSVKHASLPPIPTIALNSRNPVETEEQSEVATKNPFLMPPESELFTLRERQRRQAKEERIQQRKLKVHEKSTYNSRLNTKNASLRKKVRKKVYQIGYQ